MFQCSTWAVNEGPVNSIFIEPPSCYIKHVITVKCVMVRGLMNIKDMITYFLCLKATRNSSNDNLNVFLYTCRSYITDRRDISNLYSLLLCCCYVLYFAYWKL